MVVCMCVGQDNKVRENLKDALWLCVNGLPGDLTPQKQHLAIGL